MELDGIYGIFYKKNGQHLEKYFSYTLQSTTHTEKEYLDRKRARLSKRLSRVKNTTRI